MTYDTVDYVPGNPEPTSYSCLALASLYEFSYFIHLGTIDHWFSPFIDPGFFGEVDAFSLSLPYQGALKFCDGPQDVKKKLARWIAFSWQKSDIFLVEINRHPSVYKFLKDVAEIFDGPPEPVQRMNMKLVTLAKMGEAELELWPLGILAAGYFSVQNVQIKAYKLPAGILGCGTDADIAYFLDCFSDWSDCDRHTWWSLPAVKCSMEELPVATPVT